MFAHVSRRPERNWNGEIVNQNVNSPEPANSADQSIFARNPLIPGTLPAIH